MSVSHYLASYLLTVLHLCNDRNGVQGFANSKLVDSRDSELVLIALDKVGGVERAGFALGVDHGPGNPGCLPLLHNIVGDGRTAIIFRRVPPHGALLSCDAGETNGTFNRPGSI